ncbi:hypothetical protein ACHAW5_006251 [Stephanodiscus triporus]|uniref:Uncharacterized protein n=1 Tax=Stephanodiscus triporus TaxID=2934178 RepID=A0ABD3PYL9_9STRA
MRRKIMMMMSAPTPPPPPPPLPSPRSVVQSSTGPRPSRAMLAFFLLLLTTTTTTTTTTDAFALSYSSATSSSSFAAAASSVIRRFGKASHTVVVTRSSKTNDDDYDDDDDVGASAARAEIEARASRTREVPRLTSEDRSLVSRIHAEFVNSDDEMAMEAEISKRLETMSPRLLVALQMAGEALEWTEEVEEEEEDDDCDDDDDGGGGGGRGGGAKDDVVVDFEARMVRVGRALRRVLDGRLDSGRRLLEEMLASGEIRKLDALIGRSAREGRLDTSFFQVLSVNMRDAAMNDHDDDYDDDDSVGKTNDDFPIDPAVPAGEDVNVDRRQILQHVYTRCQEELEKNVPPGIGLLNKLLRTEVSSIRDNQLRHYLGPRATSISSPDGRVIELPGIGNGRPLVSHVELVDAVSDAVGRVRAIESAGGTDRMSAARFVEDVRRIAAEARAVLASLHGEDGGVVVEFQEALMPVFRPGSAAPVAPAPVVPADATGTKKLSSGA